MKITVIAAGKIKSSSPISQLINDYLKRFSFIKLSIKDFDDKNLSKEQINNKIISLVPKNSYVVALTERGQNLTSKEIQSYLENVSANGNEVCLIIGGAEGLTAETEKSAHKLLAFGKITLPHNIVRLIAIEQLYRVQSLIQNHPYHKD